MVAFFTRLFRRWDFSYCFPIREKDWDREPEDSPASTMVTNIWSNTLGCSRMAAAIEEPFSIRLLQSAIASRSIWFSVCSESI